MFGSQCIVVSIDVKRDSAGVPRLYSHVPAAAELGVVEWCSRVEDLGCGEILLNSVDRDGTMTGYDLELIRQVTAAVKVPVIAAGGAGTTMHFVEAIRDGDAAAAAAASVYHFTNITPQEVKGRLAEHGLPVRL